MRPMKRKILATTIKLFDLALLVVSFGVGTLPHLATAGPLSFAQFLEFRIKVGNFIVFFALLWLWHIIFSMFGLYDSKRLASRVAEAMDITKATTLAALVLGLASVFLKFRMVTLGFVLIFWAFSTSVGVMSRLLIRFWLGTLRARGRNLRDLLIVGSNSRAIEFAKTIRAQPELGYRIIGFADESWTGV